MGTPMSIVLDRDCPKCDWPELVAIGTEEGGPERVVCRKCGWTDRPTVAELEAGQEAEIYGGVHVTVISVEPVASEPDFPWVKLTYRCEYDQGSIVGTWVLPASQRLPLVQA